MPEPSPLDRSRHLVGRELRHASLVLLDRRGPGSIGELLEALLAAGFRVAGENPRKVLSDALRHEVKRGRAQRVGWGRYAIRHLARTTRWRIGLRWERAVGAPMDDATDAALRLDAATCPLRAAARAYRQPLVVSGDPEYDRLLTGANRVRWRNGQALHRYLLHHQGRGRSGPIPFGGLHLDPLLRYGERPAVPRSPLYTGTPPTGPSHPRAAPPRSWRGRRSAADGPFGS